MGLWIGIIIVGGMIILGLVVRFMGDRPPKCRRCGRTLHADITGGFNLLSPRTMAGGRSHGPAGIVSPVICQSCNKWYCRACWLAAFERCPGCGSTDVFSTLGRDAG